MNSVEIKVRESERRGADVTIESHGVESITHHFMKALKTFNEKYLNCEVKELEIRQDGEDIIIQWIKEVKK